MLKPNPIKALQSERCIQLKTQMTPKEIAREQHRRKVDEANRVAAANEPVQQKRGLSPLGAAALVAGAWYVKSCFDGLDPHSKSDV